MNLKENEKRAFKRRLRNLKREQENFRPGYKGRDGAQGAYQYLHLGFEFSLIVLLCILGGHYLDKKFSTIPLFFLFGFILGLTLGLYRLINTTKRK